MTNDEISDLEEHLTVQLDAAVVQATRVGLEAMDSVGVLLGVASGLARTAGRDRVEFLRFAGKIYDVMAEPLPQDHEDLDA